MYIGIMASIQVLHAATGIVGTYSTLCHGALITSITSLNTHGHGL